MSDGHLHSDLETLSHEDHEHLPLVPEEPLDPGSQSLADALRASFRVLKGIMVLVAILYLFSGVFKVDQNELAVVSRFGELVEGGPKEPGLHLCWPYPIDTVQKVQTSPRTYTVDAFWLKLSDAEKTKELSDLSYRTGGLNPAYEGALLTGDRAIMHMLVKVQYHVSSAKDFVTNVMDDAELMRSIMQNALIAEAARTTADVIWKDPARITGENEEEGQSTPSPVQIRAQARLDELQTGIVIDNISTDRSHYPLQVKDEFLAVSDAENRMRQLLQEASKIWEEKLKGAAGTVYDQVIGEIERLDQTTDEKTRAETIERITTLLAEKATGEAGRRIKLAEGERDRIVDDAHAQADRFITMLEAYQQDPELVRQRLRQNAVARVFDQANISRWMLPAGSKYVVLNKNPEEIRQQERDRIKKQAEMR